MKKQKGQSGIKMQQKQSEFEKEVNEMWNNRVANFWVNIIKKGFDKLEEEGNLKGLKKPKKKVQPKTTRKELP